MSKENVEDYLNRGMYGTRKPKQNERNYFLGTLRERIVVALTKGQVMSDNGLKFLEKAIQENQGAKLIFNGHVAYRFLKAEKDLAKKYDIDYTTITNEDADTDVGAVLAYDYAIDREHIFMEEAAEPEKSYPESKSFFAKLKNWFT